MTPEEIAKAAKEEMQKAFEEMKAKIATSEAEVKKAGEARHETKQALEKVEAAIVAAETKHKAALDELEKKMNRIELSGAGTDEKPEAKAARERKAAFASYLRTGSMNEAEKKALVVSNDTTGGVFAPAELVMEVIKAEVLWSPFRGIARVRPTGRSSVQIPKRTGTAAATWVGETTTRVESQNPAWGMVSIPSGEMYAEARVSNADLEDSVFPLEQFLIDEFAEQFGVTEGAAIVSGNGVNKPLGFLDANAAGPGVPIAYTPSGSAATIKGAAGAEADGLVDLMHAVKTAYAANGRWLLNRTSLGKVRKMKDTTGQFLWSPGLAAGAPSTILNAPYTEIPDMPDEGANAFPIAFGDWMRALLVVDRIEMQTARDPFTVADKGQVKFTARRRIGAQVVLGEAIRLLKCATS